MVRNSAAIRLHINQYRALAATGQTEAVRSRHEPHWRYAARIAVSASICRSAYPYLATLMIVEGQSYSFVRATGVDDDGVSTECWKGYGHGGHQGTLVAEAVARPDW